MMILCNIKNLSIIILWYYNLKFPDYYFLKTLTFFETYRGWKKGKPLKLWFILIFSSNLSVQRSKIPPFEASFSRFLYFFVKNHILHIKFKISIYIVKFLIKKWKIVISRLILKILDFLLICAIDMCFGHTISKNHVSTNSETFFITISIFHFCEFYNLSDLSCKTLN